MIVRILILIYRKNTYFKLELQMKNYDFQINLSFQIFFQLLKCLFWCYNIIYCNILNSMPIKRIGLSFIESRVFVMT